MRVRNAVSVGFFFLLFLGAAEIGSAQSGGIVNFLDLIDPHSPGPKDPCDKLNGDPGTGGALSDTIQATTLTGEGGPSDSGSSGDSGLPPGSCALPLPNLPGPMGSPVSINPIHGPSGPPGPGEKPGTSLQGASTAPLQNPGGGGQLGYGKTGASWKGQKYGLTKANVGSPTSSEFELCGDYQSGTVLLTGLYRLFRRDLAVEGRGIDWRFARIYKQERAEGSGDGAYDTRFGNGWNFTYNDRLVFSTPHIVRLYEGGRHVGSDFYDTDQNGIYGDGPDFTPPFAGENRRLVRNPDDSFDLVELDGTVWHFSDEGTLLSLQDRAGNRIDFVHGGAGAPAADALTGAYDTYGRFFAYEYWSAAGQAKHGKLKTVSEFDHVLRTISFDYDADGNLTSVVGPGGVTETYTYEMAASSSGKRLLKSVILANEHDPAHGLAADNTPLFVNSYDAITDRVVSQAKGPTADIFGDPLPAPVNVTSFSYDDNPSGTNFWPADFPYDPDYEDYPSLKTTVVDRRGKVRHFYMAAAFGAITREEVEEEDVLDDENPPAAKRIVTRYRYGAHGVEPNIVYDPSSGSGQLTQVTYPDGMQVETWYEAPADPMLPTGSSPVRIETRPGTRKDPVSGATIDNGQALHVLTFVYEPLFNQMIERTEERGNDSSYVPPLGAQSAARYTTRWTFDFMEGDAASIAALAAQFHRPLTTAQIQALALDDDINGDGIVSQQFGNVVRIDSPSVQLLSGTQEIFSLAGYNHFGQVIWSASAEGHMDQYLYHPETDADGDGNTTIYFGDPAPPVDQETGGYLKETIADAGIPAGVDEGRLPALLTSAPLTMAAMQYLYDPVGNLIEHTDALGRVTSWEYNERNLPIRTLEAQGTAAERETLLEYDRNDNPIKKSIWNPDSAAGSWVEEKWEYDLENRLVRHAMEIEEAGGSSVFATSEFGLDGNGNLARLKKPQGNEVHFEHNVRNQVMRVTRGPGQAEQARTESFYDSRGRLVLAQQHTEGSNDTLLKSYFVYDGFGRLAGTVDPVGARSKLTYDVASQLVQSETWGYTGGASPTDNAGSSNILLSRSIRWHDELGRVFLSSREVMNSAGHSTGTHVIQLFGFDRLGRPTSWTQADGDTYTSEWDGRSRLVKKTDPVGNVSVRLYDKADNLVETTDTDVASVSGVAAETFTTSFYYDDLNRLVQAGDNLGNTRRWRYDTQGNVLQFADANGPLPEVLPRRAPELGTYIANLHGNVTNFFYDGMNRLTKKEILLTATGRGNGTWNPPLDTTQSGDGKITIQTVWDKNSRVTDQIDDKGNVTRNVYDALDRKIAAIYAFGTGGATTESWIFDGADRVTRFTDQNGSLIENVHDLASRLQTKTLLSAGSGVTLVGTLAQSFEWDGMGRLTKGVDDNGGSAASFERAYDSLSRQYLENQIYGTTQTVEHFWAFENLRTAFVYPNSRQLNYTYDDLDRVKTLEGIGYEYIGKGRILERANPNGTALSYLTGTNQTGYDGVRRIVHQKTTGPSSSVLADFEYTHDREHHRKTVRRQHQKNGSNQPKGEFYDYDSAYRLTDWKESWVIPDPIVIPAGGGTFTTSASGSFTIGVLQMGGFPIATQVRGVVGTATDTQNWTLDGVGNWEQMKRKGTATNNSIDPWNQYTSWGSTAQSHDANGNLLDDGVYLYQYDFLNRMRTVTLKSTMTLMASYAYDAMNRRVEASVSSTSTRFFYDGWHAVEERVSGSVTKQFVYGDRLDEVLKMDSYTSGSISATHYYHTDALGSVIALTNASGAIVERVKYSPYGQPYWMNASNQLLLDGSNSYVNASTVGNPLLFTAARYDAETANRTNSQITDATGAYYMRNRYMDSDKGRFTTRDPIGIWGDGINLGGGQAYCGNDPVNKWDSLGLFHDFKPPTAQQLITPIQRVKPAEPINTFWSDFLWGVATNPRGGGFSDVIRGVPYLGPGVAAHTVPDRSLEPYLFGYFEFTHTTTGDPFLLATSQAHESVHAILYAFLRRTGIDYYNGLGSELIPVLLGDIPFFLSNFLTDPQGTLSLIKQALWYGITRGSWEPKKGCEIKGGLTPPPKNGPETGNRDLRG